MEYVGLLLGTLPLYPVSCFKDRLTICITIKGIGLTGDSHLETFSPPSLYIK